MCETIYLLQRYDIGIQQWRETWPTGSFNDLDECIACARAYKPNMELMEIKLRIVKITREVLDVEL